MTRFPGEPEFWNPSAMWPTYYALTKLTAEEKKISALVKQAVS